MESEREQLLYGNRCKHGTNIGTPSGADFMCQYCEDGADTWVPDPFFELKYGLDLMARPVTLAGWHQSDSKAKWAQLTEEWTKADALWVSPEALAQNPTFEAVMVSDGYWQ
jgi:hypothetical protein